MFTMFCKCQEVVSLKIFRCFLFICFAGVVLLQVGTSLARDMNLVKIKDLPHYEGLTDAEFIDQSILIEEKPLEDKFLAYQLRLPKGWNKAGAGEKTFEPNEDDYFAESVEDINSKKTKRLSRRILGKVAKYYGKMRVDSLSRLEIQALELDHEITARNWFFNYILSNGFSLEGLKVHSERRVEALYVLVEKDTAYIVRSLAEINGPRMIVVSYYVPDYHFEEEKVMQEKVIESFRFLSPEKSRIEITRTYSFLDMLKFDYPASWRLLAPNIYSIDDMDAKLISSHDEKTLNGEIKIHIISTELETTLAEEVKILTRDLKKIGLKAGELIEEPDFYEFHDHIFFSRVEVYETQNKNQSVQAYEYWLAVMAEDRYYYIITMLGPSRSADFYAWARNGEAFETVVESFRP